MPVVRRATNEAPPSEAVSPHSKGKTFVADAFLPPASRQSVCACWAAYRRYQDQETNARLTFDKESWLPVPLYAVSALAIF
jgi:hypothetical protein